MENMAVLIMEKDKDTGILSNEVGSYNLKYDINLIDRIFAVKQVESLVINMYITVQGDFKDWEFNAILDNYDAKLYEGKVISVDEDEEGYNPTWIVKFNFLENDNALEEKINEVLEIHSGEIERVLKEIKGLESEYKE